MTLFSSFQILFDQGMSIIQRYLKIEGYPNNLKDTQSQLKLVEGDTFLLLFCFGLLGFDH